MKYIRKIVILICLIGIIYSGYHIIKWRMNVTGNEKIKEEIMTNINKDNYEVNFEKLKSQNEDTVAYLIVKNTEVDNVVVKGKDNDYYLNHNFNKTSNVAGWIFADYRNKFDGSDRNIIIYGHNMRDGSMFGTLKNALNNAWQQDKSNQTIILITEKGKLEYEVFSTYQIEAEEYYLNTEFSNDAEYEKFLDTIKNRSNYDYGVSLTSQDKILTLSTCTGNGKDRVVVHARLISN